MYVCSALTDAIDVKGSNQRSRFILFGVASGQIRIAEHFAVSALYTPGIMLLFLFVFHLCRVARP